MSVRWLFVSLSCLLVTSVGAAPPSKNDYAQGMSVQASNTQPMIETELPDIVYRQVTRADLGDLRVFNADGVPVPHAICPAPENAASEVVERGLSVFVLRGRDQVYTESTHVNVETSSGTRVDVQESSPPAPEVVSGLIHIIDARDTQPLRSIRFDWSSPDGVSAVKVRIEASDDLDQWRTVVPESTLLLAQQEGRELRRERINLPLREYEYLRVQRVDNGPPLTVNSVTAEEVSQPLEFEPIWFTATRLPAKQGDELMFDAEHVAPVTFARVRLSQENSTASVVLQSRPDETSPWRTRWTGESYVIVSDTVRRESPPARIQPVHDRYWRVQILKDPQVYADSSLELGYRPARVRFLARGDGPFTLAFGSRRAELAKPAACDQLLADVSAADRGRMIEPGYTGPVVNLGGATALKPLPKQTPVKVVVLWAVLVLGVALLVGMALSLLKRVRQP
ncbi:DUF3999 domain-containing protein [Steroidobacter sp. S1-65]|uniref:DUF3999 domain-containing protein n=1 Tax=Steroidobacter gossypii TaxID=2805490 RepID=A0ABS1WT12_9GAMM|nr:DUF3999 family protein [Steroidobacter gossypii]MBM0104078.1 DUF3999 domain-containing protein [Steroidobacter gossypii]